MILLQFDYLLQYFFAIINYHFLRSQFAAFSIFKATQQTGANFPLLLQQARQYRLKKMASSDATIDNTKWPKGGE